MDWFFCSALLPMQEGDGGSIRTTLLALRVTSGLDPEGTLSQRCAGLPVGVFCFLHLAAVLVQLWMFSLYLSPTCLFPGLDWYNSSEPSGGWVLMESVPPGGVGSEYCSPECAVWTLITTALTQTKTTRWPASPSPRHLELATSTEIPLKFGLVAFSNLVVVFTYLISLEEVIHFKWPQLFRNINWTHSCVYLTSCCTFCLCLLRN